MRFKVTIRPDGQTTSEVIEREGQNCSNVLLVTEQLSQVSDVEKTGPETDSVEEILS